MFSTRSLLRLFSRGLCALAIYLAGVVLASMPVFAHEGHAEHDAPPAALAAIFPRVVARSEQYEVVGVLKGDTLTVYVDHVPTNEPASDVSLTITIGDGDSAAAEAAGPGVYKLRTPTLPTLSGSVEVVFGIAAPSGDDLLVGAISPQPAPVRNAPTSFNWTTSLPSPLQSSVLIAVMLFILGLAFGRLELQKRRAPAIATIIAAFGLLSIVIAGAVSNSNNVQLGNAIPIGDLSDAPRRLPDGSAFVSKPSQRLLKVRTVLAEPTQASPAVTLPGRVIGDPDRTSVVQSITGGRVTALEGGFPRIGQPVRKGEQLVKVEPHVPQADRTTISERLGEIDQLISVAEGRLDRLRPLAERGAVPRSQVADAETELDGLRRRRETVRTMRTEREILTAPTDGVIALAKAVQGQVVQAQDLLFQIVDPQALLIEALVYGGLDPATFVRATAATPNGGSMELQYRGYSRALQHHAAAVHFKIVTPPPRLSLGQVVTVSAGSSDEVSGLTLPRDAVVRSSAGESIVWLQVDAERFEPRPVRTLPFDAARLIVAAGVEPNDRIVIRSADMINQVR